MELQYQVLRDEAVRTQHVTNKAKKLNVLQPAPHQSIRRLERELGDRSSSSGTQRVVDQASGEALQKRIPRC